MRQAGLAVTVLLLAMATTTACRQGAGLADGASGGATTTPGLSDGATAGLAVTAVPATAPSAPVPAAAEIGPSSLLDCGQGPRVTSIVDHSVSMDADPKPVDSPLEAAKGVLGHMRDVVAEGEPAVILEVVAQTAGTARVLGRSGDRAVVAISLSVRAGRWTIDTEDACFAGEVGTQVPPPVPLTETLQIDARSTLEPPVDGVVPPVDVPAILAVARPAFDRSTFIQALLYGTYVRNADGDEPTRSVPAIAFTATEACVAAGPVPASITTGPMMCTHHVVVDLETMTVVADVVTGG